MPQYLKQTNTFDCGPTAMVNLLKWIGYDTFLGQKVNKSMISGLMANLLHLNMNGNGVFNSDIKIVLDYLSTDLKDVTYLECDPLSYKEIKTCIQNEGSVLLCYNTFLAKKRIWDNHIILITDFDGENYTCLNIWGVNVAWVPIRQVRYLFAGPEDPSGFLVWRSTRKELVVC